MMPYPGKKKLVLIFGLVFTWKLLLAVWLRSWLSCAPLGYHFDELVIRGHDYFSYHAAMENYLQTGTYYFFNGQENVYAGRLPHFSLLYLFFRQFVTIGWANLGVVLVQLAAEAWALLLLAGLASRLVGKRPAFYWLLGLGLISLPHTFYSLMVLPDSLSVSFLIGFAAAFAVYLRRPSARHLGLAGLWLALVVVLKPYFSLLYVMVGLYFFREPGKRLSLAYGRRVLRQTGIVSVPLLLLLLPWIVRNYQVYGRFIPFQVNVVAGYHYTRADLAARNFLQAFGEDLLYWDTASAGYYFKSCRQNCTYQLPDYLFSGPVTRTRIAAVRAAYQRLQLAYHPALDKKVAVAFNRLTADFARAHPFRYYGQARLTSLKNFFRQAQPTYLPPAQPAVCYRPYHRLIYYLQLILFWGSWIGGMVGLIFMVRHYPQYAYLIAMPVYLVLFFPLVTQFIEGRYLLHSYPFLLLGLVYLLGLTGGPIKPKQEFINSGKN